MSTTGSTGLQSGESATFAMTTKRLLGLFHPLRAQMMWSLALSLIAVVLNLVGPRIWGYAVDQVLAGAIGAKLRAGQSKQDAIRELRAGGQNRFADIVSKLDVTPGVGIDFGTVGHVLLLAASLYCIGALGGIAQQYLQNGAIARVIRRLRDEVEEKIHRLSLSTLNSCPRGELLSRMTNDVDNVAISLSQTLTQLLFSVLTVVGVLAVMVSISGWLTLVALVSLPPTLAVGSFVMKRSHGLFGAQWQRTGELNTQIEEAYTGHELVTMFDRGHSFRRQFAAKNAELKKVSYQAQFVSGLMSPTVMFIGNLGYIVLCVAGAFRVIRGELTLGEVTAFVLYARQFAQPVGQLASMANLIQSGIASAARVFGIIDTPEQEAESNGKLPAELQGRVSFENVTFGYGPTPVIEDLDLIAEPGQTVAIVGATGAGKTTLVNLLMRFYEVDSGRVVVDGTDIASVPRKALRERIGMVPQGPWLFGGTIRENIAYGRIDATPDQIDLAARASSVDRIVRTLPRGYDTVIDDDAGNLSEGERQLICIARAFISDPRILVLDEATSAVDARTEFLLQQATSELRRGRTCFVIAHRLSTIRDADVIVVLRAGRIVEKGTHAELLSAEGEYHRLYQYQFQHADPQPPEGAR